MRTKYRVDVNDIKRTPVGTNSIRYVGDSIQQARKIFAETEMGKDAWNKANPSYGVLLSVWSERAHEYEVIDSKFPTQETPVSEMSRMMQMFSESGYDDPFDGYTDITDQLLWRGIFDDNLQAAEVDPTGKNVLLLWPDCIEYRWLSRRMTPNNLDNIANVQGNTYTDLGEENDMPTLEQTLQELHAGKNLHDLFSAMI